VVATPRLGDAEPRRLLIEKIRSIASVSGLGDRGRMLPEAGSRSADACVLIGSSAGGPAVLTEIIRSLPTRLEAAIVIVQHVDERFSSELASWLGANARLPVRLANDGDELIAGLVLVAKGGHHLVFGHDGKLHCTDVPAMSYQPSVDVLFESAVRCGPRRMLGVILTGMGRDGARGLLQLREAGHPTIAQDEESSAIYGMPRAAIELGAAAEILCPSAIADRIIAWSSRTSYPCKT